MPLDFSPLDRKELSILELAHTLSKEDLRHATNESIDFILDLIKEMSDRQLVHIPNDPKADDPFAPEEHRYQGWSVAHLVLHVTASSEEYAAFSSLLARGITLPKGTRLRYEPDWKISHHTKAESIQRLEESRRIRLAYLDAWPDDPHTNVFRVYAEESPWYNQMNCVASFMMGLRHEMGHYDQFREAIVQAQETAHV